MDDPDPYAENRIYSTTLSSAFAQMADLMRGRILNVLSLPSLRSPPPESVSRCVRSAKVVVS
jgi:hypothetical protein